MKDNSMAEYILSGAFDAAIDGMQRYSSRATGFENWDTEQVFLPGLYVLGGTPGTGKTTFALQLLSQLAVGDAARYVDAERCIFCAYEMSRMELTAKSIAREVRRMWLRDKDINCLPSSQIRLGAGRFPCNKAVPVAQKKIADSMRNLHVLELEGTPIDKLIELLKTEAQAAKDAGMALTVAIDYLQLIPVGESKASAKEKVDEIVLKLKNFQRATDSTVIVISSLNREACKLGGDGLFNFKESGSIEYSADVTWQLVRDGEVDNPRRVKLKCAKNRNGSIYDVDFDYYADSDYFCGRPKSRQVYSK
ncbi:MAG: AAA family ATPase [Selenomonadaceae bacterium]|nr:AAA family ATPase [Selenomonadaceae bacterium]